MTCLECQRELSYMDHRKSMEMFQAELCPQHLKRLERLLVRSQVPIEAVMLYYGLKQQGIRPMLAWWDGEKTVDLAISRVRLNIEIDRGYESLSHQQALHDLDKRMHCVTDGFTNIRIPDYLIRTQLAETVAGVRGIVEGLKESVRVV